MLIIYIVIGFLLILSILLLLKTDYHPKHEIEKCLFELEQHRQYLESLLEGEEDITKKLDLTEDITCTDIACAKANRALQRYVERPKEGEKDD